MCVVRENAADAAVWIRMPRDKTHAPNSTPIYGLRSSRQLNDILMKLRSGICIFRERNTQSSADYSHVRSFETNLRENGMIAHFTNGWKNINEEKIQIV